MQKVTFSMCFLRCSGILNFCVNYVHNDSGKPQKSQECLIKILTPTSMKTMNNKFVFCFHNLCKFQNIELENFINCSFLIVLVLFGLNFVMTLACTVWH